MLAVLEKYDNPHTVVSAIVFHDIGETRIGDIHLIAKKYIQADEESAVRDQLRDLPFLQSEILDLWKQVEERGTILGNIAKDADLLEQAITAKEFAEKGYSRANTWIDNVELSLKTKSAQLLLKSLKNSDSLGWWNGLNSI